MPSKWYFGDVKRAFQPQIDKYVDAKAQRVVEHGQDNIQANDQIDTGFMRDSGYVVSAVRNTHDSVGLNEVRLSSRTGEYVERQRADAPPPNRGDDVIAGFSADYTIDQELENSFLWRGVEQVAAEGD